MKIVGWGCCTVIECFLLAKSSWFDHQHCKIKKKKNERRNLNTQITRDFQLQIKNFQQRNVQ
jgi:hypothetical protein